MRIKLYRTFVSVCFVGTLLIVVYTVGLSDPTQWNQNDIVLSSRARRLKSRLGVSEIGGDSRNASHYRGQEALVYHGNDTRFNWEERFHPLEAGQRCTSPRFAKEDRWQTVIPNQFYVFSAYLDDRGSNYGQLRIIGAQSQSAGNVSLWCHMWKGRQMKSVKASRVRLLSGDSENYIGILITCQLFIPFEPEVVALTPKGRACVETSHGLAVHQLPGRTKNVLNFTVCLSTVITHRYTRHQQFVEWMEAQTLFGADHIVVYTQSESPAIAPFITHYINQRRISLVDWILPFENEDILALRELALLSDCMYRMMYTSRHVLFLRVNEFLVPGDAVSSWQSVMTKSNCPSPQLLFFHVVNYDLGASDDETFAYEHLKLLTQAKTTREKNLASATKYGRYVVQPEEVYSAGWTNVQRLGQTTATAAQTCHVAPEEAMVHSYTKMDSRAPMVTDRTFHKFQKQMVFRVSRVYERVRDA